MTAHWAPTARTYLGRVTKTHILAAVREAVSDEAAGSMADMKKQAMAEAACRNRLAARADANAASRSRARRTPAGDSGRVFRRRQVIGVAGTLHAVPVCHRAGAKILAARLQARGQSHDAQAFDRARCGKPDTFPPEAGREGRLMPSAREPARGAARRRRESRNDEKKSPNPAKLHSLADLRIFLVPRAGDVTMAAAQAKAQYTASEQCAAVNVGGRIIQRLITNPLWTQA